MGERWRVGTDCSRRPGAVTVASRPEWTVGRSPEPDETMIAGTGIYTPRDAAALLGEQPATVRRGAWGYSRPPAGRPMRSPPLIATELPEVEGEKALTFVELVELLYVRAFQRLGVPWQQ